MAKRYTDEQKEKMKEEALAMKAKGITQQKISKKLGISPVTLSKLLNKGKKGGKKRGRPAKAAATTPQSAFLKMAEMETRVSAIDKELDALTKEREDLMKKMKPMYDRIGKEIFK
jgi:transposase-like protein